MVPADTYCNNVFPSQGRQLFAKDPERVAAIQSPITGYCSDRE